jgi:subtilisin family serine protease
MAQPHVAGVVALLLSKYPHLTDAQLDAALAEGAVDVGATGRDLEFGWGVVNAERSLAAAARLTSGASQPVPAPSDGTERSAARSTSAVA